MYLHKVASTYGRVIPKPAKEEKEEDELFDETKVPIQDQIENLRAKISLKERYNRVLNEELEESRLGATTILSDLYQETRDLRFSLIAALNSEKTAVQHALRSHRLFQLAMSGKKTHEAIPWLDDKLFDVIKHFNACINHLVEKRKKLEDAERMVIMIEKWPRPGTLPWELDAIVEFTRLENDIERAKVKRETAAILYSKYYEIKFILREERGKYLPTLRALETQLDVQTQEYKGLETMLEEAYYFRDEAARTILITEKEASENRKERRKRMAKMKRACQKIMESGHPVPNQDRALAAVPFGMGSKLGFEETPEDEIQLELQLQKLRAQIERYNEKARRLVEAMRVPDLTYVPLRIRTVRELGERLKAEQNKKEEIRENMIKQKNQLQLVLYNFRYTGLASLAKFNLFMKQYEDILKTNEEDFKDAEVRLNRYGHIFIGARLAILSILSRLDEGKPHRSRSEENPNFVAQMKLLIKKIGHLVQKNAYYETAFKGIEPERNYGAYVKPPSPPVKGRRVGSPVVTDESDEDEIVDSKTPNREEIKNRSRRFIQHALLKKGLS